MSGGGRTRVRPLRVRPGARFACAGDGLCCTDAHALGPVDPYPRMILDLFVPGSVVSSEDGRHAVMARDPLTGACIFRTEGRCALHAAQGEELKPEPCRRYPLGLTATPSGGRVVTEHACSCRTLGDRPVLEAEAAEASLKNRAGRLSANARVNPPVRLSRRRRVGWDRWERIESELLARLLGGEGIEEALEATPFGALAGERWEGVGEDFASRGGDTRHDVALRWFGEQLLSCLGRRARSQPRPWREEMARGEARSVRVGDVDAIFAEWAADEIWALRWTYDGTFEQARAELVTRLAVARRIARALRRRGVRRDTAAAEAVMVVDIAGATPRWRELVSKL